MASPSKATPTSAAAKSAEKCASDVRGTKKRPLGRDEKGRNNLTQHIPSMYGRFFTYIFVDFLCDHGWYGPNERVFFGRVFLSKV